MTFKKLKWIHERKKLLARNITLNPKVIESNFTLCTEEGLEGNAKAPLQECLSLWWILMRCLNSSRLLWTFIVQSLDTTRGMLLQPSVNFYKAIEALDSRSGFRLLNVMVHVWFVWGVEPYSPWCRFRNPLATKCKLGLWFGKLKIIYIHR